MADEIAWELPEPFTIDLVVAKSDIDDYGHTNNTVYLGWCDRCAWAHSEAVGLDLARYRQLRRAMALRSSRLEFLAPSFEGDRIRVANWIVHADGRLRATRRYQIGRLDDGVTLMRAEMSYVCIDLDLGKPRRLPSEFAERYVVLPAVAQALEREQAGQ